VAQLVEEHLDLAGQHHREAEHRWDGDTHKHGWTDRFGDKVAYSPSDITAADPFDSAEYERTFREFCSEGNIRFDGQWSDPSVGRQAQLDV
jgi:hypothetical protein